MPQKCSNLKLNYQKLIKLYKDIQNIPNVKHVFIQSGFRYELFLNTKNSSNFKS